MEDLSLALGFRSFGALCGSVLCGMLADRYRGAGDIIIGCAVIVAGFPEILKPLTHNLAVLGVISFIGGLGQGGLEAVGHGIILWMWGDRSGPPFHAIHMGYPIGSMLSPLIAMPFLGPDNRDNNTTTPDNRDNNTTTPANYTVMPPGEWNATVTPSVDYNGTTVVAVSRIEVAYGIVGGISCIVGFVFMIWYFLGTPKDFVYHGTEKSSILDVFSPASCQSFGTVKSTCLLLFLACIFYVFEAAKDSCIGTYIFSFAVESDLDFKKQEAAKLDATGRSMEVVGRAVGILTSHWFKIQPLIFVEVISNVVFTTCLVFFGTQSKDKLWVFLCLFKLTAAPVWPSGMTWISVYLKFSPMIVALIQVVRGVSDYFFNWTSGYLYDNFSDWLLFYGMICGYAVLCILVTMQLVASCSAGHDEGEAEDDVDEYFMLDEDWESSAEDIDVTRTKL